MFKSWFPGYGLGQTGVVVFFLGMNNTKRNRKAETCYEAS